MLIPLNVDIKNLKYAGLIGTGGIGSGKFFRLNNDHTLGREESRSGHFLNINDYCKQHIILHYIKVLMGPSFSVMPVGKVGDDDTGNKLFEEMGDAGLIMAYIEKVQQLSTLFSFCFYYPDGSGGNLTTDDSASASVSAADADNVLPEIKRLGAAGIIMAAPEVPLSARYRLLTNGKANQLFCAASFTSEEMPQAMDCGIFSMVDLLAINMDEAKAISSSTDNTTTPMNIVEAAILQLQLHNKNILVSVTDSGNGSWCWDGNTLNKMDAMPTTAVSSAGAGDAFFAGLLCGIAAGLTFFEAQQLATLLAGLSVTSPHTIHKGIDRLLLNKFLHIAKADFSNKILKLLED